MVCSPSPRPAPIPGAALKSSSGFWKALLASSQLTIPPSLPRSPAPVVPVLLCSCFPASAAAPGSVRGGQDAGTYAQRLAGRRGSRQRILGAVRTLWGGSPPSLSSPHSFSSRARLPAAQHPSPLSLGDGNGFGFGAGPPGGMAVPQPCWWLCSLSHRPAAVGRGRQRGLLMPRSLTRLHPTACEHPALTGTGLILHPDECFLGGYRPAGHRRVGEGWSVCRVGQRDGSLAELSV